MPTLRIQHSVPTFDAWKRAFDSDPLDRKGGGVRRYDIRRSVSDPNLVMIDLEFDTLVGAEASRDSGDRPRAARRSEQGWPSARAANRR